MAEVNDDQLEQLIRSLSPRTRNRLKAELSRGDARRLNSLVERRILHPIRDPNSPKSFRAKELPYSYDTHRRRERDIRLGRTTADRPDFIAWDGEGRELASRHRYILLANSRGGTIENSEGLGTKEILDFMVREYQSRTINIFYSFGYDIQQIIHDVPDDDLLRLLKGQHIFFEGYRLQYFANKIFTINNHIRFYDIFNFFHISFVRAVKETLGKEYVTKSLIEGKEARSDFESWSMDQIKKYNNEELQLLTALGEKLREIFTAAGIELRSSYYGPGAIARYWFRKFQIKPITVDDDELNDILERAYFGGRFETFILGKQSPIYEYDIHSAYPSAIRFLRYVDDWHKTEPRNFHATNQFSVWKLEWHLPNDTIIGPFPSRDKHGLISYPANGIGWYYKPEVEAALSLYPEGIHLIEGINPTFVDGDPFTWVEETFKNRRQLKKDKNPAEWALKVGMNSLYGKTAQRVGKNTFFCLPWAGWITSNTRAKLLNSVKGNTSSIVAFATDAVYSTSRLSSLDIGDELGQFESKQWTEGIFIQSGVYRLIGESTKDAYRGFHSSNGLGPIFDQLNENPFRNPAITQTRFVTHLEAIKFPKALGPHRLKFVKIRKELAPYRPTKRIVPDIEHHYKMDDEAWADEINAEPIRKWNQEFKPKRGKSIFLARGLWPDYRPLLAGPIQTRILENMNDHRDLVYGRAELGPFEESYPFVKLLSSFDKHLNGLPNDIAEDRLGGAVGIIQNRSDLPIVDERTMLEI